MVDVVATLAAWREQTDSLRTAGRSIGLVPTMGALHAGHASLFERAASECDVAAATIFVNPLQFDDPADYARYQSRLEDDLAWCEQGGVQLALVPAVEEVWPSWPAPPMTRVSVAELTERYEGSDRPGHFDGVATVVAKLLGATGPCRAYFGEKDYQQLCVVRRLVADLSMPVEVVGCATVRAHDGLALSSRNDRLRPEGRRAAVALSVALRAGGASVEAGDVDGALAAMHDVVAGERAITLAYAAVVAPDTLRPVAAPPSGTQVRLLIAATIDGVRLLDNLGAVVGDRIA
jgi:pantoate--beta-alanine ligase